MLITGCHCAAPGQTEQDRARQSDALSLFGRCHMGSVTTVLRHEILLFPGALALIVFYQLLMGRINMRRMLFAKGCGAASGLSPSRMTATTAAAQLSHQTPRSREYLHQLPSQCCDRLHLRQLIRP